MGALDVLTEDEALAAVNMVGSGADHALELGMWVSAISEAIDAACGPVVIRTVTETLDASGGVLFLTQYPVDSVTTVTEYVSGTGTVLTAESTTAAGGYLLRNGILARRSSFSTINWNGQITVVYEAGRYANTEDVGAKFKLAAASILRRLWAREASAWSRGGDVFGTEPAVGFFRVAEPMIEEFLGDELKPPAIA